MPRIGTEIFPSMLQVMSDGSFVRGAHVEASLIQAQVGIKTANILVETRACTAASGFGYQVVQIDVADFSARPGPSHFQLADDPGAPPEMNAATRQFLHPGSQPVHVLPLVGVVDIKMV